MRDLGALNATIEIPSDYMASENGLNFINEDKGCAIMTDYFWNIAGPIYSLSDVESQRESIVAQLMQDLEVSDYQILTAGQIRLGIRTPTRSSLKVPTVTVFPWK